MLRQGLLGQGFSEDAQTAYAKVTAIEYLFPQISMGLKNTGLS